MRIHYLQHVAFEGLGNIKDWAESRGHDLSGSRLFDGQIPSDADAFDCLIVMGGPMSVGDVQRYPWLIQEKKLIKLAIDQGKTVLGICLGAQLIAEVLGARVYANDFKEIGWFQIHITEQAKALPMFSRFPDTFPAFHWHGDTFSLPDGAVPIGRSSACANQGFIYADRVVALQFHLEPTQDGIERLVKKCANEMTGAHYIQTPQEILSDERRFEDINDLLNSFLDGLAGR